MMETLCIEKSTRSKQSFHIYVQRLLRNKVYIGIKDEKLVRKVYRSKRDSKGKKVTEIFYVNSDQSFRIEEAFLIKKVNEILQAMQGIEDCSVEGWSEEARRSYFVTLHKSFMKKKGMTLNDYNEFISNMIESMDEQIYLNMKVKQDIKEGNLEDVFEKIEVYETGILCIFKNGFEMSLQF